VRCGCVGRVCGLSGSPSRISVLLFSRRSPLHPTTMTSIYLGNLSWSTDEAGLTEVIAQYAQPTSVEIKRNKNGKSLGYAIATFESADDGRAVVEGIHGSEVDGREVTAREDRGAKPSGGGGGGGRFSAPRSSAPRAVQASSGSTNHVFVGNLSWDTNDETLVNIFEEFFIVSASVQRQPNGTSKGWALVEFGSAEDAAVAIEQMNGAEVDGREIICREDRGPPGGGGGGGGDDNKRAPRERRGAKPAGTSGQRAGGEASHRHANPVGDPGRWVDADDFQSRKSFGHFQCGECGHTWMSAHTYRKRFQQCQQCDAENHACCMWVNDHSGPREDSDPTPLGGRPHDKQRCEACHLGECDMANR
jgi:RNA recognition motif-containing protein